MKLIYCIELNKMYLAAAQAEKELNIPQQMIEKVLNGQANNTHGFHFTYIEI